MEEKDGLIIFLDILWKIFRFIWICFAYCSIMYIGHIMYDILFNNIEYSESEIFLCGIAFSFCIGMIKGYYEDTDKNI